MTPAARPKLYPIVGPFRRCRNTFVEHGIRAAAARECGRRRRKGIVVLYRATPLVTRISSIPPIGAPIHWRQNYIIAAAF